VHRGTIVGVGAGYKVAWLVLSHVSRGNMHCGAPLPWSLVFMLRVGVYAENSVEILMLKGILDMWACATICKLPKLLLNYAL
jgi:hypothetical protein